MRNQRVTAVLVAGMLYWSALIPAYCARFVDLSGDAVEKAVNALSDKGVIAAEPDGKFKGNEPITRAILAQWMVKTLALENQPVSSTPSFPDVKPSDPNYKYVEIIRQNNYISGFADGFRPNGFIQKGEVIAIIARALPTSPPSEGKIADILAGFTDGSKIPSWAKAGIAQASEAGILINYPDHDTINATKIATRADAALLLDRLNQYLARQDIAETTKRAISPPPQSVPPADQLATGTYPAYQGKISEQAYGQPGYGGGAAQSYPPPQGYPPPAAYPQAYVPPQGGYPPLTPGYPQTGAYPPPQASPYLEGRVAVVAAGTRIQANLKNTLDSGSTQPGEPVEATLSSPIYSGGVEVVPAGSKLTGQVTNVVSAKRFRFGANGKIDIRFTAIETPDGRRFPLSASIDDNQLRLTGGSTAGRIGKGLVTTGVGAAGGAALGTALGAIVGATSNGRVGKATGMGAVFGTAMGGGVGAVGAVVRKGSEVTIHSGTPLPIQLDESLQVSAGPPPGYGQYRQYPPESGYHR